VGEHDFSAFRASECQANSPIKTLYHIKVERFGDCVLISISANAFLHHMVRNMVGSLVYIGAGKQPQDWLNFLLQQKNRALSAPTFSSAGLYLSAIHYPEAYDLPAPRDDFLQALGLK
jgi:tRNA pseudouridine38-40 synthase